jgi:hypothetical protein
MGFIVISAASDAKQHIDALIAAFNDKEVDDDDLPELMPYCIHNSHIDLINMERFIFGLLICIYVRFMVRTT